MNKSALTTIAISRRSALCAALMVACTPGFGRTTSAAIPTAVEVWKDPECGCCKEWVAHMEAAGFKVKVHDVGNNAVRARLGIDKKLGSCHTALVGGYALEGHVPAREVKRLLTEKPAAIGLAVSGMPVGSPGMDGAVYGGRKDSFDVVLLVKNGPNKVYRRYEGTTDKKA